MLAGQGVFGAKGIPTYIGYRAEVLKKLQTTYLNLKHVSPPDLQQDGINLAKTMEDYSNYAACKQQKSNYNRILHIKLKNNLNPEKNKWWVPSFKFKQQNWTKIFQGLLMVLKSNNPKSPFLKRAKEDSYFSLFSSVLDQNGHADNLNDFKFLVDCIRMFKILFTIISPQAVARLTSALNLDYQPGSTIGVARFGFDQKIRMLIQDITFFNPLFYSQSELIQPQYQAGWFSTNSPGTVVIHEFGHCLANLLSLPDQPLSGQVVSDRAHLNATPYLGSDDPIIYTYNELPSNYLVKLIGHNVWQELKPDIKKLNTGLNVDAFYQKFSTYLNMVITYSIVRSIYGRLAEYDNYYYLNEEIEAEAFAQWLLTPPGLRTAGWQELDVAFGSTSTKSFPGFYHGTSPLSA